MNKKLLAAICICGLASSVFAQTPQRPAPLKSPEAVEGGMAFRLNAPNAKEVILDIEGVSKETMVKNEQGVWSFTKKLEPDVYDYAFVVDGMRIPDPINPVEKPCYQCNGQSLAHVPGPASLSWEIKDVPRGVIAQHTYRSAIMGEDRGYYVYLPPNYDANRKVPYPVFFLLHGATGTAESWNVNAQANIIMDNLIAEGKAKPMIMVTTLGYGGNDKYADEVIKEIIPQLEKAYKVSKDRNQRAIAGLSMGGGTSFYTGLNNLDYFAYIGGFSSAVGTGAPRPAVTASTAPGAAPAVAPAPAPAPASASTPFTAEQTVAMMEVFAKTYPKIDETANAKLKLLYIACGVDDPLSRNNNNFKQYLTSKNVKFKGVDTPGAHTFMVWRRNLTDFVPLLFK